MTVAVSQQASDATETGLWAFAAVMFAALLILIFGPAVVRTIGGLWSALADKVELSWEQVDDACGPVDDGPELLDWSTVDWDALRAAGRERANAERRWAA